MNHHHERSAFARHGFKALLCTGLAGIVALELTLPLAPQVTAAIPGAPLPEVAPAPDPF
jgi:hypothetical protein